MKKLVLGMLMVASMNVFAQDTTKVKKEHKKEQKGEHKKKGENKSDEHRKKGENRTGEHRNHQK